ncbi:MAG: hypothetical protein ABFS19_14220 [Thermodesulfobacteriota bacterium]
MSTKCKSEKVVCVSLEVDDTAVPQFTTLLQSGIFLEAEQGETIGGLLAALPGFSEEYIKTRVQTIFLNGLPADDLDQPIFGSKALLAISTAMPGLAGAIFRKGGKHASLRTTPIEKSPAAVTRGSVVVRLKIFALIAKEKGEEILAHGCRVMAAGLGKSLAYRPPLVDAIREARLNGMSVDIQNLLHSLSENTMIDLTIRGHHGS